MAVTVLTADEVAAALAEMRGVQVVQAQTIAALTGRVAVLEGATPGPDPDPPTPPSGFWLSGGNGNNNRQDTWVSFCNWRGKPGGSALTYVTRESDWGPWQTISGQPAAWTDKSVTLFVQLPTFPKGAYTYADAAAGRYIDHWKAFGAAWAAREAAGFARPVFFPNWEANHFGKDMHYWCGGGKAVGPQRYESYDQYIAVHQLFVTTVRKVYPGARFGWNMVGHDSPGFPAGKFPANDPRNIWPGKEFVDVVGVDYYDMWPGSPGGNAPTAGLKDFDAESRDVNGVRWYGDFALAQGCQFAVPEWAVTSNGLSSGHVGGDNPEFVKKMRGVFEEAYARRLPDGRPLFLGECYYEDTAQGMSIQTGQNPKAAAEYRRLWAA